MTRLKIDLGTIAMAATFTLSYLALFTPAAQAQNPFNDSQTWANQPPGAFLNSKAVTKKSAVPVKKPVAKLAPLKQNVQQASQGMPQFSTQQPEQFQQRQPMGQSDWQQMGGNNSVQQQQGSQQGASDWVEPNGDSDQSSQDTQPSGQGWVTNTQAPVGYGQSNSNSGGQMGSSGWNTPGGTSSNTGISSGSTGGGNQSSSQQNAGVGTSGWVTPGGGSGGNSGNSGNNNNNGAGAFSSQGVGNYQPPQQASNQSQWNTAGNTNSNTSSPPAFPPSSFTPAGQRPQQGTGQAPLLGDVLEQEQLQGGIQSSGGNMGTGMSANGGASGSGQAMPAFSQGSAAGFMPAIMNMMQNIMPAKGGGYNPNLGNNGSTGSGTLNNSGSNVFVPQQQIRRPVARRPMQAPRIVTQTGKQVSRQLNRSVNRMLYQGIGNLRF